MEVVFVISFGTGEKSIHDDKRNVYGRDKESGDVDDGSRRIPSVETGLRNDRKDSMEQSLPEVVLGGGCQ